MVSITNLYKTELSASKYNLDWVETSEDSVPIYPFTNSNTAVYFNFKKIASELITITVTLKDFKNRAVTSKGVTVTCTNGYFNNNENTKSITLTTNSNGVATTTYRTEVIGTDIIRANETSILINAEDTGWFTINEEYTTSMQTGLVHWDSTHKVQYRRYKNIVQIRGPFKATNGVIYYSNLDPEYQGLFMLPPQFHPNQVVRRLEQGTGAYKFIMMVYHSGLVCIDRYNNSTGNTRTNAPENAWINMDIVYTVND